MKLLIDAHLPRRLVYRFTEAGHDAIHTLDLNLKNRTPDREINAISIQETRIVVTKDEDFVTSFYASGRPFKLLLVSTGNIANNDLERLFLKNMDRLSAAFSEYSFIEIDRRNLIFHT